MKNKKFTLKKVPLEKFIRKLNDIYMSGADFVDLHGISDDENAQDEITLTVPLDYMSDEAKAQLDFDAIDQSMEKGDGLEETIKPEEAPKLMPPPPPPLTLEEIIESLRHG